jgi:hypothetical protein
MASNIAARTQTTAQRNEIKRTAAYWDEWSGSRYVRRINPILEMDRGEFMQSCWSRPGDVALPIIREVIIRSCAVTGDWFQLEERVDVR